MSGTLPKRLENGLRRIRENIAGGFRAGAEDSGPAVSASPDPRRAVPLSLTIADVMQRDLATVLPESPVRSAVRVMVENRISSVPVVDVDGRIVGALNEGDLMKVFYEPHTKCVADVMTCDPIVVSIESPLVDVIDGLMSTSFRRVLIQSDGKLVGVITRSDVMPALLAALENVDPG